MANALPRRMMQARPAAFRSQDNERSLNKARIFILARCKPKPRYAAPDDQPQAAVGRRASRIGSRRDRHSPGCE